MQVVRRSYESRLAEFVESDESLVDIIRHVSQGGTVVEFCDKNDLRLEDILAWVKMDASRSKDLDIARECRKTRHLEEMISQLRDIMNSNISQAYNQVNGDPLPMNEWPLGLKAALSSYDLVTNYSPKDGKFSRSAKFRVWDKLKVMEMIGKLYGIWVERVEHSGNVDIAHRMRDADTRLEEREKSDTPTQTTVEGVTALGDGSTGGKRNP